MELQLLIADGDGCLSALDLKSFAAHGYCVRVASGGVECLMALRETTPDVLVLDTELRWGGADGVLAVMDEEHHLSTIPIVLLHDTDGMDTGDSVSLSWPSISKRDATSLSSTPNKRPLATQVVDRLLKPFRFQNLLDSIGTATARPHSLGNPTASSP